MASPAEHEAAVRRLIEGLARGEFDLIDEVFAEEITFGSSIVRGEADLQHRDDLREQYATFVRAFDTPETRIHDLVADDDTVIVILYFEGTHVEPYRGIEATGNEVSYEMWLRYVFEDGRIVHSEAQGDNFGLFTQLGLELSIEGYRTLIETAPDPIVIADLETGEVVETNEAAVDLLERPRDAVLERRQADLHPDDRPYGELFAEYRERARDGTVRIAAFEDGADVELERRDGSRVPVEINAQVVTLAEFTTFVSIYRDVSGRQRREQRLQVLNRVLRHNIRNDLAVVDALAESVADEYGGAAADYAGKIGDQVDGLLATSEKARDVERIGTAEDTPPTRVDVEALVESTVEAIEREDPAAEVSVQGAAGRSVLTGDAALQLALANVLENAVEHGGGGDVAVRVRETGDGLAIEVADDGPGIPGHEIAAIEAGEETPLEHGSGIGLWLVRWAMDAIRGEVAFESDGSGTRVTLTVPSLDEPPA